MPRNGAQARRFTSRARNDTSARQPCSRDIPSTSMIPSMSRTASWACNGSHSGSARLVQVTEAQGQRAGQRVDRAVAVTEPQVAAGDQFPEALDPSAGVIAGLLGDQGRQDGGSGQPRGLRFDCSSRPRNCAFHASPRRCSRESPTYVAALRSIAVRSASDRSRRTLPGTPATSTPSGTCCPSASTVPAAMIE